MDITIYTSRSEWYWPHSVEENTFKCWDEVPHTLTSHDLNNNNKCVQISTKLEILPGQKNEILGWCLLPFLNENPLLYHICTMLGVMQCKQGKLRNQNTFFK